MESKVVKEVRSGLAKWFQENLRSVPLDSGTYSRHLGCERHCSRGIAEGYHR